MVLIGVSLTRRVRGEEKRSLFLPLSAPPLLKAVRMTGKRKPLKSTTYGY